VALIGPVKRRAVEVGASSAPSQAAARQPVPMTVPVITWEIEMIKTTTAPYGIALLRVSLGILFLAHLALKIFVFTIPGFVGYFASLGLPAVAAYGVMALELVGGISLVLGIYAPWIAVPLAIEMLGTIVMVHGHNGWLFTNKGGGWEYPAFWAISLVAITLLGDGAFALRPSQRLG
jgi:putative oxidoreductase